MMSWDAMNCESTWRSATIKIEPQEINYAQSEDKPPSTESNPTSPQSMDRGNPSPNAAYHSVQTRRMANSHTQRPFEINHLTPPTPPGYPNPSIPTANTGSSESQSNVSKIISSTPYKNKRNSYSSRPTSLTPSHTPPMDNTSPMDDTPPKSPKDLDETPEKDMNNASNSCDSYRSMESDCDDIRTPKVNSHGKIKTFKCKQCEFVALTKINFWDHIKTHIKQEKLLSCPNCPFVTEYKHHLEYHLRNHTGSKPFLCEKCNYSCVNKSMLNSHMKSHSSVYQYRCKVCGYATKYCHSLKIHLRKTKHMEAVVLNEDGTPNPLPIIDVYGTRRGPKNRSNQKQACQQMKQSNSASPQSQQSIIPAQHQQNESHWRSTQQLDQKRIQQQQYHQQQQQYQQQQLQNFIPSVISQFSMLNSPFSMFNYGMLAQHGAALAQFSPRMQDSKSDCSNDDREENEVQMDADEEHNNTMKKDVPPTPTSTNIVAESENSNDNIPTTNFNEESGQSHHRTPSTSKNRRKGRAYKLNMLRNDKQHNYGSESSDYDEGPRSDKDVSATPSPKYEHTPTSSAVEKQSKPEASQHNFECKYCDISFKQAVIHSIHMGYHGFNDVFKCNMCGEKCDDSVSFFLHIAKESHSK